MCMPTVTSGFRALAAAIIAWSAAIVVSRMTCPGSAPMPLLTRYSSSKTML